MTLATAAPAGRRWRAPVSAAVLAPVCLGAAVVLVLAQHQVRRVEAHLAGDVLGLTGAHGAGSIGTAVVFFNRGHFVGYSLTAGCTSAFLMVPFLVITAGLLAVGRLSVPRGLLSVLVACTIVFVVNQARLLLIAQSMRWWGTEPGFERSHVLLGTVLSTLGVLGGLLVFVAAVARWRPFRRSRHAR